MDSKKKIASGHQGHIYLSVYELQTSLYTPNKRVSTRTILTITTMVVVALGKGLMLGSSKTESRLKVCHVHEIRVIRLLLSEILIKWHVQCPMAIVQTMRESSATKRGYIYRKVDGCMTKGHQESSDLVKFNYCKIFLILLIIKQGDREIVD